MLALPCCPIGENASVSTREMRQELPMQTCEVSSSDDAYPRRCKDMSVGKLVAQHWVWESWNFTSVNSRALESRERVLDIVKVEVGIFQLHGRRLYIVQASALQQSTVGRVTVWYLQFGFRMSLYIRM